MLGEIVFHRAAIGTRGAIFHGQKGARGKKKNRAFAVAFLRFSAPPSFGVHVELKEAVKL